MACVYNLVAQPAGQPAGCNPAYTTIDVQGGGGVIAIVDAFDYPTAASDLAAFSQYFDLPAADFQVVYAGGPAPYITGAKPAGNSDWNTESALDIEWAHALAPNAKIYLVEAQSDSNPDLMTAVQAATYLVSKNGGGQVSMSWSGTEYNGETGYDKFFSPATNGAANVVFLSAAGEDNGLVEYPPASPYVIGVGGTTINRDKNGNYVSETTDVVGPGGGGVSAYEAIPSYQIIPAVEAVIGTTHRGTPDISLNAVSGVAVYQTGAGPWSVVAGTSLATPAAAAILNVAHYTNGFPQTTEELATLYANGSNPAYFRDITSGNCGPFNAKVGFDLCTGWGSPLSYGGK